ncbi:MAG: DUF3393 domain-containing protein [Gammaproteobacteria bacterium]|nr:DUF3393 domain-containing protein [Gammaproteobacteria bacterium]
MKRLSSLTALLVCFTLLLGSCTKEQLIRTAISRNPEQAIKNMATSRAVAYTRNPRLIERDAKALKRNISKLINLLKGNVEKEWGKDEAILASKHRYVKYTQNYKSRALVNFDSGLVTVETLDTVNPNKSLFNAIVTTLLTPEDPRAVDLYSDKGISLSGRPYLHGLVRDHNKQFIGNPGAAERYSDYLIKHSSKSRPLHKNTSSKKITYVQFSMIPDHIDISAKRYQPYVARYSKHFGISRNLVYAIIKTESNFNPYAVSSAPAYGLMQLVPSTGGRDAYYKVKGKDIIPSRTYLFDPGNNIELGTAYFNLVYYQYLKKISNPVSREYCAIAAYNTGSGNVLKTFSSNRDKAVYIINRMKPSEVYAKLKNKLNSHQARRYLVKVMSARRQFVNI